MSKHQRRRASDKNYGFRDNDAMRNYIGHQMMYGPSASPAPAQERKPPVKSNIIDIEVEEVHRTGKAVLVHTGDPDKAVWLPMSLIEIEPSDTAGAYTISLPERIAQEKGLI